MISADRTQGAFWVVSKGLAAGDKVITQGLADIQPNTPLRPVPANTPQPIEAPSGNGG
jgi:membrane fusion protein (multidrug efflux system)